MAKQTVPRTRAGGMWTEARFHSFIKSALRSASMRWPPKSAAKKEARTKRGWYQCAGYKRRAHEVPATLPPPPGRKRRIDNAVVDHIIPVIGPEGFVSWDETISRMFVEKGGLQILCHECHSRKTQEEREDRRASTKGAKHT